MLIQVEVWTNPKRVSLTLTPAKMDRKRRAENLVLSRYARDLEIEVKRLREELEFVRRQMKNLGLQLIGTSEHATAALDVTDPTYAANY